MVKRSNLSSIKNLKSKDMIKLFFSCYLTSKRQFVAFSDRELNAFAQLEASGLDTPSDRRRIGLISQALRIRFSDKNEQVLEQLLFEVKQEHKGSL